MKKFILFLIVVIFVAATSQTALAQLSKKEKKEWKKKLKSTDPADFKNMLEENSSLKTQLSSMNAELSSSQSRLSEKDSKLSELQSQINNLEKELAAKAEASRELDVSSDTQVAKGVIFKVQIGAYRNKDLSKYLDKGESFSGESGDEGMQKYTLGNFRDYWEADSFKKYLREMGVKDAWIVPYKDGERVAMKDVLEGVVN